MSSKVRQIEKLLQSGDANSIFNVLAPSQASNSGKYLTTNGTTISWGTVAGGGGGGTISSVTLSVPSFLTVTGSPLTSSGTLSIALSGTPLPIANGGTGVSTSTGSGSNVLSISPTLVTPNLGTPSAGNFSTGTFTWPTFNQNTTGSAASLSATLLASSGGTGQSSYTTGDLLYASSTTTIGKLAGITAGYVLLSGGGASTAEPQWGKLGLTTHVSGSLPIANGGTGQTTAVLAFNALVPSQTGNGGKVLTTDGTNTSWATISGGGGGTVTSVSGTGTVSGLTLSGTVTTSGSLTLGGTLTVANSATTATNLNTASAIVARDASGNFTAGTITAALVGNVTGNVTGTAATITGVYSGTITSSQITTGLGFTPYNATNPSGYITSAGTATNVSGIVAVANGGTGTATPGLVAGSNVTITGTWPNQTISSTAAGGGGGTVTSVSGTGTVSGLTLTGTVTSSGSLTLGGTLSVANSATTATNLNTASAIVARDASGNFSAGTITAALTGNVTGNLTGNVTGNVSGTAATITGTYSGTITSSQITTGLGFTPYSATNPNGYITSAGTAANVSGTVAVANGGTGVTSSTGTGSVVLSSAPTLVNPTITNYTETTYTANTSTAITVSLANGTLQILTLTAAATITMPTAVAGKSFVIILRQDATGSRTVTWSTVNWASGTAPTVTSTASKQDIFSFFSDGISWYGTTIGQNYTQ